MYTSVLHSEAIFLIIVPILLVLVYAQAKAWRLTSRENPPHPQGHLMDDYRMPGGYESIVKMLDAAVARIAELEADLKGADELAAENEQILHSHIAELEQFVAEVAYYADRPFLAVEANRLLGIKNSS